MNVIISVDKASLDVVFSDILSARGGHILSLDDAPAAGRGKDDMSRINVSKVYIPPDPFYSTLSSSSSEEVVSNIDSTRLQTITACVPLKEMVGYLKHFRSLTGGRGTFVMSPDRFVRVVGQREKSLLKELRGY